MHTAFALARLAIIAAGAVVLVAYAPPLLAGIVLLGGGAFGLGVVVTLWIVFGSALWWEADERYGVQPVDPYTEGLR